MTPAVTMCCCKPGFVPGPPVTGLVFATGLRRVHVSPTSSLPADGSTPDVTVTTIQAGLNALQAGDVMTVAPGTYRETLSISGLAGTVALPIWIASETPGAAVISGTWAAAEAGTVTWTDELETGVWSAPHGDSYIGSHGNDFLMRYKTKADLVAAQVQGTTKPTHGFAFEGGSIYVRLRGDIDPNGESIVFCDSFSQVLATFTNCDNVIFDGFVLEGAGDTLAVEFDAASARPTVRNCVSTHNRHMARVPSDAIVEWNDYSYTGFGAWMREVLTLDGEGNGGIFDICKNYHQTAGNAHLEGGICVGTTSADSGCEFAFNHIHSCFDGMRLGEFDASTAHDNVFRDIGDNVVEFESFRASDQSADLEFFHNLCIDCHGGFTSHQAGNDFVGPHRVYRNLFLCEDGPLSHPTFMIKTINAPATSTGIDYYHNMFKNIRGVNENAGGDTNQLWSDGSSQGGDKITTLRNNVLVFEDDFDDGSGPNPTDIAGNILVSPTNRPNVTANGGSLAGATEAALNLGANYQLLAGSPLISAAVAISGGLPDVVGVSQADVGPFPDGFDPGADWPRPQAATFDPSLPSRWTSPG